MLRLPRPEVGITEGCNFAIAAVLLNVISGVSVMLWEPNSDSRARDRGKRFLKVGRDFYPWHVEPRGTAIRNPGTGAELLYSYFRNPMIHSFGFQDPEPEGSIQITRLPGAGYTESDLATIEQSESRPSLPPTLQRQTDRGVSLQVDALYWGVRDMFRRLTADTTLMESAERYLEKMVRRT